jgi:hypothetical protein
MDGRNFTRVIYSAGASIRYDNDIAICKTNNVSLQGMYLKTDADIPLNLPVHVTLYHSNQSSLKANARVVRKEANGVGVLINNINADSFAQLRDIVVNKSGETGKVMQETFKMLKSIQ